MEGMYVRTCVSVLHIETQYIEAERKLRTHTREKNGNVQMDGIRPEGAKQCKKEKLEVSVFHTTRQRFVTWVAKLNQTQGVAEIEKCRTVYF